jgi:hypothetical protein
LLFLDHHSNTLYQAVNFQVICSIVSSKPAVQILRTSPPKPIEETPKNSKFIPNSVNFLAKPVRFRLFLRQNQKFCYMKKLLGIIIVLLFPIFTQAQIPSTFLAADLSLGAGSGLFSGAIGAYRTHGLFASQKLRLGYGLRLAGLGGSDLRYVSAPPELSQDASKRDTLMVASALTMGLNAAIYAEYQFNAKFKVGFNIDALGLGFGSKSKTKFISSEIGSLPAEPQAKPTSANLLLIGDNDIGHLRSEFYVGYAASEKIWLRGGLDMTFSEYTTTQKLTRDNDRFRHKAMAFFVALSYSLK